MFSLRSLREEDLPLILRWRNSPHVRERMFNNHVIGEREHRAYFARIENDPSTQVKLCVDEYGEPVGVVNFTAIDHEHGTADWGFYAGATGPKGTGTKMLYSALVYAFGELALHKVSADVISTNEPSVRVHRRLGFLLEGTFKKQRSTAAGSIDVYRFALFERDWTNVWRRETEAYLHVPDRTERAD